MTNLDLPSAALAVEQRVSTNACTHETVEELQRFLGLSTDQSKQRILYGPKSSVTSRKDVTKSSAKTKSVPAKSQNTVPRGGGREVLDPVQRVSLATQIVNSSLKALTVIIRDRAGGSEADRKSTQESLPLQTLSPNRQTSNPLQPTKVDQPTKHKSTSSGTKDADNRVALLAECSRMALEALRKHSDSKSEGSKWSFGQIELGMSSLVGKLLALGMDSLASKELRSLLSRLEHNANSSKTSRVKSASPLQPDSQLVDLLACNAFPEDVKALETIITSHIQVLKLLSKNPRSSTTERILHYLEGGRGSVLTAIETRLARSPSNIIPKASKWLDQIAQALEALAASKMAPQASQSHFHNAFRCRILASRLRLRSCLMNNAGSNIQKQLLEQFTSYTSVFAQERNITSAEKYVTINQGTRTFLEELELSAVSTELYNIAIAKLYRVMADVARENRKYNTTYEWLEKAQRIPGVSSCTTCALACLLASTHLQQPLSEQPPDSLSTALRDASIQLKQNLEGSAADMDDVFVSTASLRKHAVNFLVQSTSNADEQHSKQDHRVPALCKEIVLRCIRFLIRYAQGIDLHRKGQEQRRNERRQGLIARSIIPTVEALAAVTRVSLQDDTTLREEEFQCLQDCESLIKDFDLHSDPLSLSQQQSRHPSITISNALWCRYLNRKSEGAGSKEQIHLLRKAIDALEACSPEEKDVGFLFLKYEKLGCILETKSDLDGALSRYEDALQVILSSPTTLELFNGSEPFLQITSKSHKGGLARLRPLISNYMRVQTKLVTSLGREFVPFHSQLSSLSDGCILELQLTIALDSLQSDACLAPIGSLEKLHGLLKASYTTAISLLQRVHFKLMRGFCIAPTCFPDEFRDVLHGDHVALCSLMAGQDELRQHSKDRHDVYMAICMRDSGSIRLPDILSLWHRKLSSSEYQDDRKRILDSPEFLDQLQLLQEYLIFDGHEVSLARVTDMLMGLQRDTGNETDVIRHSAILGQQLTRLGHCELARKCLSRSEDMIEKATDDHGTATLSWYLSYSEYLLDIGNTEKCRETLILADKLSNTIWGTDGHSSSTLWDRYQRLCHTAQIMHLKAGLSKAEGNPALALYCAKKSTRVIHRAWAILERYHNVKKAPIIGQLANAATATASNSESVMEADSVVSTEHASLQLASFWTLGPLLYAHTASLAYLLTDEGQLLEAQYYMDKADKMAQAIGSSRLQAENLILKAYITRLAGEKFSNLPSLQKIVSEPFGLCFTTRADMELALAEALHKSQNLEDEIQALKNVELVLEESFRAPLSLPCCESPVMDALDQSMARLNLQPQPNDAEPHRTAKKSIRKPKKEARALPAPRKQEAVLKRHPYVGLVPLVRRQARRLRQSALLSTHLKDFQLATKMLQEAKDITKLPFDIFSQALCDSTLAINQAVSILAKDPVFSLVQESSIMHPSVSIGKVLESQVGAITTNSGKGSKTAALAKVSTLSTKRQNSQDEIMDVLATSSQCLLQASKTMQTYPTTAMGHTCSDSLFKAQLLLSIASPLSSKAAVTPASLAYSLEYGRSLAYLREEATIVGDRLLEIGKDSSEATDLCLSSVELKTSLIDVSSFQSDYVDIIPSHWTALSISVSADREELRISRMRAHNAPMTLSIPLNRHNPRECEEEEPFGFDEGKSELLEIISLANYSAHEAVDVTTKGSKTAWWETRAALDARLKDLVNNVQNMWIGGFRGIFSEHVPSRELLARFQTTLNNIMNKHLPSRQRTKKGTKSQPVYLDTQVLELFIGLGHPSKQEDLEETLLDLFYFVVDILQFHGERNAYDEIDFDPIILETLDALTHYHNAAAELEDLEVPKHTILILDKSLHAFPWESLPCLDGQSVSRLPSLSCLRDRIIMQQKQSTGSQVFQANANSGSYILNPSGDLASTHKTFGSRLSALTSWDATVKSTPTEAEITTALSSKSLYLYFGHGSGAQYARNRAIRKLERCAVALLMGCSSGSLTEAGELESYGPLMAYLHAGSPAVVGTLWDVTDRDIDRFAVSTLERWGLFETKPEASEKGKGRKPKGKTPTDQVPEHKPVSLDQAVAESRSSCILKYLNGAAPVVYGVPVMLK